jgi:hypothetical protein
MTSNTTYVKVLRFPMTAETPNSAFILRNISSKDPEIRTISLFDCSYWTIDTLPICTGVQVIKCTRLLALAVALTLLVPQLASTNVGLGEAHDALHGFGHPLMVSGHIFAMVSVGLLVANLSGNAIRAVPASFVVMMVLGDVLGMAGICIAAYRAGN